MEKQLLELAFECPADADEDLASLRRNSRCGKGNRDMLRSYT